MLAVKNANPVMAIVCLASRLIALLGSARAGARCFIRLRQAQPLGIFMSPRSREVVMSMPAGVGTRY